MNESNSGSDISRDPIKTFDAEKKRNIERMGQDEDLKRKSYEWALSAGKHSYEKNFTWLGRPIIQIPTDIVALQEIIWEVKPDLIIETGIAHGGSLVFSASMMELLNEDGKVVGIDIDIRSHNKAEIESHPMMKRIIMIEGSSIDPGIVLEVEKIAKSKRKIMVFLDSCHTHEHVMAELQIYSRFVSVNSYLIVFDTFVGYLPEEFTRDRPWGPGNNPLTAVREFLRNNDNFAVDDSISNKLQLSASPGGYLRRVK